ncbi:hypothetical protein BDC45DRAFT_540442 [Circinella umbellata]|nr:hypothetical protein BDC45DRAFT_540442 [Circinella umbellata]
MRIMMFLLNNLALYQSHPQVLQVPIQLQVNMHYCGIRGKHKNAVKGQSLRLMFYSAIRTLLKRFGCSRSSTTLRTGLYNIKVGNYNYHPVLKNIYIRSNPNYNSPVIVELIFKNMENLKHLLECNKENNGKYEIIDCYNDGSIEQLSGHAGRGKATNRGRVNNRDGSSNRVMFKKVVCHVEFLHALLNNSNNNNNRSCLKISRIYYHKYIIPIA